MAPYRVRERVDESDANDDARDARAARVARTARVTWARRGREGPVWGFPARGRIARSRAGGGAGGERFARG